jgi:stringent starvation protein B
MSQLESSSTRPYLIRAIYEWCTDNGYTPHLAVVVDQTVQVPLEYVNNGEIVLNVGFDATSGLDMGNDYIRFQARFAGVVREIIVPVDHVIAIYARENGQGMAFPPPVIAGEPLSDMVDGSVLLSERDMQGNIAGRDSAPALHLIEDEASTDDEPPEPPSTTPEGGGKSKKPALRIVK